MTFPSMQEALWGLTDAIQFEIVKKTVTDYQIVESPVTVLFFQGCLQPIPPRKLLIKPEGQRSWKWWTLYSQQLLDTDWIVQDPDAKQYRVMSVTDWGNAGYFEYELTENPES